MSDIYVFGPKEDDNDYSTMGLIGALEPEEVTFKETLNGDSLLTMKHPLDEFGAFLTLNEGNILVVPVPVRTTPEIQNGSCVTTVWTYKVKPLDQLTSKNQRTLYKKKTGSGKKKVLPADEVVTVVLKPEDDSARWKVKSKYGEGWINASADGPDGFELVTEHTLSDNSQAIEEVQSPWVITPQYFRIYEVNKSMDEVEVNARHISYDLLHNLTIYESETSVDLQTALNGVLNGCIASHDFEAFTNVSNTQPGLFYKRKNPIDAFLNDDDGLCTKYDVCLIRDNYSLYFLHDPGLNRGVRIEYAKNMTGIKFDSSIDEVATRILPVGEKKDGTDLYLSDNQNERYIDSSKINSYPVPHVYELKCDNCKVGDKDDNGGKITVATARARMKAQAEALLANGCDEPKITMSVEFINLGDTLEYAQFKDLENCFLADYVIVQHPELDIDVTARIVEIEWDCLLDRMNSVTIGQVGKTLANTGITSWQIPSGISGAKIGSGTLGNAALKSDIISAIHMQADSINTQALQAQSVTAEKIAAGSITADKIAAGSVTADKIAAGTIEASNIKAGTITGDQIAADTITGEKIVAGTITGDKIAGKTITAINIAGKTITADQLMAGLITADSGLIATGAIGTAQIADGSITSAKIVSLNADVINAGTIKAERLLIAGEDGLIYQINATSSGLSQSELTEDQYKQQINGTVIVAKSITAAQIAAATITGNEIAANTIKAGNIEAGTITGNEIAAGTIKASNIDVTSLFANEAFINGLYTDTIYGGKSLKILIGELAEADIYDSFTPPETAEAGKKWLDRSVTPVQLRRWKGLTTTPSGAAMTTDSDIDESVSGRAVTINNSGNQIDGTLSVTVQGKNLLNLYTLCNAITSVQGGTITKWPESGGFEITATADDCYTEPWNGSGDIPVEPNTTYTFSWGLYITPTLGTSAVMWFIDHRFENGYYGQATWDDYHVTFTTPSDAKTVSFRFGVQKTGDKVGYGSLQLEMGSAQTAFSKYKDSVKITRCGKNLFDVYAFCNAITSVQSGTMGKWPENGGFDLTATAHDCYTNPWNGANYDIPVKPNTTYTLGWDIYITPTTGTSTVMWFIDHRSDDGYSGSAAYSASSMTFTTPADAKSVSFRFGVQNEGESVGYTNLQLEEGNARTAFEVYNGSTTETPLANDSYHGWLVEIEPQIGLNNILTDADAMSVAYVCSGWETVNDTTSLKQTANDAYKAARQALEGVNRFGEYVEFLDDGTHMRSTRGDNEMILSSEGAEIKVQGKITSRFISNGVVLGNYILWHPEKSGGMAFNLLN